MDKVTLWKYEFPNGDICYSIGDTSKPLAMSKVVVTMLEAEVHNSNNRGPAIDYRASDGEISRG